MKAIEKKFYNLFWTDIQCQSIFSVHRAQLLESEVELILSSEKFLAQRLVLTNSQKRKTGLRIAKRTENESIELIYSLQNTFKKYFDEDKIEIFIKKRFGKTIKKIEKDLSKTGGWFKILSKLIGSIDDEKDLFKLLADYHLIPEKISNKEEFGIYVEEEIKNQTKTFLIKQNLSDLAISIDLLSTYYNHKIKNNLVKATKHYTNLFYDEENFQDRIIFFDDLYEIGVITGGKLKGYYECVNCPPNTFNGIVTTNVKPSKLKLKCPNCNSEMLYIIPFELDRNIYKNIVHKDGVLFFAIKHLLEENNYKYLSNQTFLKDVEIDFCLQSENEKIYEIVEVKMFKIDRPFDTQVGNIRDAVSKFKKAIDKLVEIDLGYKTTVKHSLVTNITDDSIYKQAKSELNTDLKEYKIELYTMNDYYVKLKQ